MGSQCHITKTMQDTLNPKWNSTCQFFIRDLEQEVLCITVFERDQFSPDGESPPLAPGPACPAARPGLPPERRGRSGARRSLLCGTWEQTQHLDLSVPPPDQHLGRCSPEQVAPEGRTPSLGQSPCDRTHRPLSERRVHVSFAGVAAGQGGL